MKPDEKRVWFHCSSLGEFEQGRPVMEKLKARNPELKIVLTFFSPSGYEIRKDYAGADYVFYMPADTKVNAADFISLVNPQKVFFTKYEYWHHYFHELKKEEIPLYMISAIFRPSDRFFKWYGGFFRSMLKCVTRFFVQDTLSAQKLNEIGFANATIAGDTRFDRVVALAKHAKEIPVARQFSERQKVLVAGSTWSDDEKVLADALGSLETQLKLIIAPHEINDSRIAEIKRIFSGFRVLQFSMSANSDLNAFDVLLIDNIGMLSSLYRYGSAAYIGGGFGKGIHNILEAAVYGIPVLFGPTYSKFIEAKELIKCGGAFSIASAGGLRLQLDKIYSDNGENHQFARAASDYVQSNSGATDKIIEMVFGKRS